MFANDVTLASISDFRNSLSRNVCFIGINLLVFTMKSMFCREQFNISAASIVVIMFSLMKAFRSWFDVNV